MTLQRRLTTSLALLGCCLATPLPIPHVRADDPGPKSCPALAGYADYQQLTAEVAGLSESEFVTATTIGKSRAGRNIHLLVIGKGKVHTKPALLVVGNVVAPHVAGSELALRVARQLADKVSGESAARRLLDQYTVYVIPRPNPDGTERCIATSPWRERRGNLRRTDDDRDGEIGEDPANDLNGDGWVTMMRVRDDSGDYMSHPDDPRVMIEADREKNERGQYRLYTEGCDDDHDEAFNEDGASGVSLNRNFPFEYPYFEAGAGPHQVSEPETRTVADFAYDHPNIALVLTFSPHDNLMHPWKPNAQAERSQIKTKVLSEDAPYLKHLAEKYRELHGGKDAPAPPAAAGSFAHWAYFHYGRWSLATHGWWVPKTASRKTDDDESETKEQTTAGDARQNSKEEKGTSERDGCSGEQDGEKEAEKNASREKRGADDLNALRWFAQEGIDGFVDWQPMDRHPDFPDAEVEIGGFKPFYRLNPAADRLDKLAENHTTFLLAALDLMPQLTIHRAGVESLGAGVFRVTVEVRNTGYLPTVSLMGQRSEQHQEMQVEITLPDQCEFIRGNRRERIDRLAGNGGRAEIAWLVRVPGGKTNRAKLRVWMPTVGEDGAEVELKGED